MLSTNKPLTLSMIMLNVVMLSVMAPPDNGVLYFIEYSEHFFQRNGDEILPAHYT